jgi:hypothetical protein
VLIADLVPNLMGWSPIRYMTELASELMDAELLVPDANTPSPFNKALSMLHRRAKHRRGSEACLLICADPSDLIKVLNIQHWRTRFKFVAAWIIDSFWLERFPTSIRLSGRLFDHFFVTSMRDVDSWREKTGVPTTWLPWGTDAFRLGGGAMHRTWDVTRVGRQPPEWDDDTAAAKAAALLGIKYQGRPRWEGMTPLQNLKFLMSVYGNSKYILAFSNSANPEKYTHPTRQYLTGRWVDALACGAVVAGIAPRGPGADLLLWPGATLELGSIRRCEGLEVLAAALKQWTPEIAAKNHTMALKVLDWRWRFKIIADVSGTMPAPLEADLALLQRRVGSIS